MITVYGIKNCDTVKKARNWLEELQVPYQFHDFRVDGVDKELFIQWLEDFGDDKIVNRRGTTWRKLPDEAKESSDINVLANLMMEHPAIIKRPVFELGGERRLGFAPKDREDLEDAVKRAT